MAARPISLKKALSDIQKDLPDGVSSDYIFGITFYKFLCEKINFHMDKELGISNLTYAEAYKNDLFKETLRNSAVKDLGYFIEPKYLFKNISIAASEGKFILDDLKEAFAQIEESAIGQKSEYAFKGIFEFVDLESSLLGESPEERNAAISNLILNIDTEPFSIADEKGRYSGSIFRNMLSEIAKSSKRGGEEFYTPINICDIASRILSTDISNPYSVYDAAAGSGSLLLNVYKSLQASKVYGQEINPRNFNLARMNFIIHGVDYDDFDLRLGDSLENPQHLNEKFDVIVSQIPFSSKWSSDDKFLMDERFAPAGNLAPKSKADFAFIEHMLYHLKDDGIMLVVVPKGLLFRGSAEEDIRRHLVGELNCLDAVMDLPFSILMKTSVDVCILVFKKSRKADDEILFVDSSAKSSGFESDSLRIILKRIFEVYRDKSEIEGFSSNASLKEVENNGYNLNISRYVDASQKDSLDYEDIFKEIEDIDCELKRLDDEIELYSHMLGIPSLK